MKTTPDPNWSALSPEGVWRLRMLAVPIVFGYSNMEIADSVDATPAWVAVQLAELRHELKRVGTVTA